MAEKNTGRVVQVIGPVLDVEFDPEALPEIYNALSLTASTEAGQEISLVAEVQQHIGRGQVRAVSMSSTDGVTRGMEVVDTGQAIAVPVGEPALGRILNVLGDPVETLLEMTIDYTNIPDGLLPVELTSFTALVQNGRAVLRWETASELNNAGFEVQQRAGGVFARSALSKGAVQPRKLKPIRSGRVLSLQADTNSG